jgi:hypothetical protein
MAWGDGGNQFPQIDESVNLKICDLCGALNLASDVECVVCRWRGHFERRPEVVRIAIELHADQRDGWDNGWMVGGAISPEDRLGFAARWKAFWGHIWRTLHFRRY